MFNLKKLYTIRKLHKEKMQVPFNEKIWAERKSLIERQNAIDAEQKELTEAHKKIKFPSWSKLLLIILFINFTILEIFVGWVTIHSFAIASIIGVMPDFTPLITLLGAVIGETISYGIYSAKSKAENTEGGIVYEQAKWEMNRITNEDESCG